MGHYELAEVADVYTQLMFADYESVAQIAPGGSFFDTNTINCDNPLLSAQQLGRIGCDAAADCGWHTRSAVPRHGATSKAAAASSGSRTPRSAHCSVFAAQISENWDYDASRAVLGSRSRTSRPTTTSTRRAWRVHWTSVTDPDTGSADVPLGRRRHRSELRAVQPVPRSAA